MKNIAFLSLLFIIHNQKLSSCERLHGQIYSSIEGGAACFRRLNGTHQAGCSSSNKGAVGVVVMLNNASDVQWLIHNATAGPYMAVVDTALFNNVVDLLMDNPDNVAGVLLYDSPTEIATSFSQESKCPNEYASGPGSKCSSTGDKQSWNEKGTGLLRKNIPFAIFYLPKSRVEEIEKIRLCHDRYNLDRPNQEGTPLCSLQMNSFMYAAVNSVVCMRRSASTAILTPTKVCDPLGDHNVYYSLFPRGSDPGTDKKPVTLVTARIDTASLFDGVAPGAASAAIGLATLITAAATLAAMTPQEDAHLYEENVLFTLFNGEAFDYIGSQRVAYDLSRGQWPPRAPLTATDVRFHADVGQLGGALASHGGDTSWPLYAFAPDLPSAEVNAFAYTMNENLQAYNMSLQARMTDDLPPSSLHSFRRILSNVTRNGQMPELVLVDHETTFTNKFYHSALDDYEKIGFNYHNISVGTDGVFKTTEELLANGTMKENELQVKVARLATALARTLYHRVTKKDYSGNVTTSAHLVDEMSYCLLRSQSCRLLSAAEYAGATPDSAPARPAPLYVGVAAYANAPALFAGNLLALLAGRRMADDKAACDKRAEPEFTYLWLRGFNHSGVCIQTTMNYSQALSPAFTIPNYDMSSGLYSTWTESVWQAMWARVFVAAGGGGARAAAAAGATATLMVAVVTYWLSSRADRIFAAGSIGGDAATGILRTVNC